MSRAEARDSSAAAPASSARTAREHVHAAHTLQSQVRALLFSFPALSLCFHATMDSRLRMAMPDQNTPYKNPTSAMYGGLDPSLFPTESRPRKSKTASADRTREVAHEVEVKRRPDPEHRSWRLPNSFDDRDSHALRLRSRSRACSQTLTTCSRRSRRTRRQRLFSRPRSTQCDPAACPSAMARP